MVRELFVVLLPFHMCLFSTTLLISKHVCIRIPSPVPLAMLPWFFVLCDLHHIHLGRLHVHNKQGTRSSSNRTTGRCVLRQSPAQRALLPRNAALHLPSSQRPRQTRWGTGSSVACRGIVRSRIKNTLACNDAHAPTHTLLVRLWCATLACIDVRAHDDDDDDDAD